MSLNLYTKNGLFCKTPETDSEDLTPKFNLPNQSIDALKYYRENGYVVLKGIFSEKNCDIFYENWNSEVKSFKGYMYRQASAKLEKHVFNINNWVMNPILNLQSLNSKHFPRLRVNFEKIIASNLILADFVKSMIGDKPTIVQSMFFEGNSATWEHQDSYYLDDEETGKMVAGWIALEDIKANAGRFFVCPKSHLHDYASMDLENIITKNHTAYIKNIVKIVKENNFSVKAPKLDKGDILLWNSLTIHGSLDSQSETNSRSSITFHVIRSSSKFQVLRNIFRNLKSDQNYPFGIYRPKDLNKKKNRIIFFLESNFSGIFYKLKNMAIELKVKKNKKH